MNILLLLFYRFYVSFAFIVLLLLLCHVCYCDACKCLHALGICVWFYPNKLMMMMNVYLGQGWAVTT